MSPTRAENGSLSGRITAEAERLGVTIDAQRAAKLARLVDLLAHWASRIRLTGSAEPGDLIERHLADAFMLSAMLPDHAHGLRCIDVGSGGGMPALPVAILRPRLTLTLVEPNSRKCAFLRSAAYELGLSLEIDEGRVEAISLAPGREPEVAWSRATFPPAVWLRKARRLITATGQIVLFAARQERLPDPSAEGLTLLHTKPYALADGTPRLLASYAPLPAVGAD